RDIKARQKSKVVLEALPAKVHEIFDSVRKEGREILMEHEARRVCELCGVPTPRWAFVQSVDEAVRAADQKGIYPLAMKIASPDIVHKTDVGGVVLNIRDGKELRERFEAMISRIKTAMPKANLLGVNLIQMVNGIECIVGI